MSHSDAKRIKDYLSGELDWPLAIIFADNAAQELNIHFDIKKKIDDMEAVCKTPNDGIYYLNFITFIGHGVIND